MFIYVDNIFVFFKNVQERTLQGKNRQVLIYYQLIITKK